MARTRRRPCVVVFCLALCVFAPLCGQGAAGAAPAKHPPAADNPAQSTYYGDFPENPDPAKPAVLAAVRAAPGAGAAVRPGSRLIGDFPEHDAGKRGLKSADVPRAPGTTLKSPETASGKEQALRPNVTASRASEASESTGRVIQLALQSRSEPESPAPRKLATSAWEAKGEVWNRASADFEHDVGEDDLDNHFQSRLELQYRAGKRLAMVAAGQADNFLYPGENDLDSRGDVSLHNFYLDFADSWYALRAGQQILVWGKTDEISPLNILNPEDLRDGFVRPRSERKIPIPMLNGQVFSSGRKLEAVFIPFFRGNEMRLTDADWAYFGNIDEQLPALEIDRSTPPDDLSSSEYALRYSTSVGEIDIALDYLRLHQRFPSPGGLQAPPGFHGPDSSPTLEDLAAFAAGTGQVIKLEHQMESVYGAEFETNWEQLGLRGDVALAGDHRFLTGNGLQPTEKKILSAVLGVDYSSANDFYVNVQLLQQTILDYDPDILFFERTSQAISGEFAQEILETKIKLDLYYYYQYSDGSYYLNPSVRYKASDRLHLEFGTCIIGGPKNTLIGHFGANDAAYVTLKLFL